MLRTRRKPVGREPKLRDQILDLLIDVDKPMTARDIAEYLNVHKTSPFRPLNDLIQDQLVFKDDGLDGAEYRVNKPKIVTLQQIERRQK